MRQAVIDLRAQAQDARTLLRFFGSIFGYKPSPVTKVATPPDRRQAIPGDRRARDKSAITVFGLRPVGGRPKEFAHQVKSDIVTWKKLMKDANILVN